MSEGNSIGGLDVFGVDALGGGPGGGDGGGPGPPGGGSGPPAPRFGGPGNSLMIGGGTYPSISRSPSKVPSPNSSSMVMSSRVRFSSSGSTDGFS